MRQRPVASSVVPLPFVVLRGEEAAMLVRQSLYAGLLIAGWLFVAVVPAVVWRAMTSGTAAQFYPVVCAPLVVTGIVAVRRAWPWVDRPVDAALAGACAGLATALLSIPIFLLAAIVHVAVVG